MYKFLKTCFIISISVITTSCSINPSLEKRGNRSLTVSPEIRKEEVSSIQGAADLIMELKYDEAKEILIPLVEKHEKRAAGNHVAEAFFWLGYCHEKQDWVAQAIHRYNQVILKYSESKAAQQAKERLDSIALDKNK